LALKGTVIGARGLPKLDSDGTDSLVRVKIAQKRDKKGKQTRTSGIIHDTSDPDWNFEFDLGKVKRGDSVEFTILQSHKILGDEAIGVAKKKIGDIEFNNPDPIELTLEAAPKGHKFKKPVESYGSVLVVLTPEAVAAEEPKPAAPASDAPPAEPGSEQAQAPNPDLGWLPI
jgi:plastocyanin